MNKDGELENSQKRLQTLKKQYEKIGKGSRFKITSAGPDGEFGTDDDLTNIEDKK